MLCSCEERKKSLLVNVISGKEEVVEEGYLYTPSTQSFLRGHHWFEKIKEATISFTSDKKADINFDISKGEGDHFSIKELPLNYLVPRLHYKLKGEPDDFDLFNLMMAEYSRNGLSFPYGMVNDKITHFETSLLPEIPWKLAEDYEFLPNPKFKPVRFSVVNNCLSSGLWEMNASDKTGEIYHSWFSFPKEEYYKITAGVNNLPEDKVKKALVWKDEEVEIDLSRLRKVLKPLGGNVPTVVNEEVSYSSQGSRRKLSKGFVTCEKSGNYVRPDSLCDMLDRKVKMSKFIEPGIYSVNDKMEFDFSIYKSPLSVEVFEVEPYTSYNFNSKEDHKTKDNFKYIELHFNYPNNKKIILGNLPLNLLVQKEDYTLHGFGVGILSASGFAERRPFLIDQGYHPSFAYLAREDANGKLYALNSHGEGLEQVFIRSFPTDKKPHWDITFTSYERITDIVKYRVPISQPLIKEQIAHTEKYITPVYFSYRDDNLR
ncbi:hypothetical protein GCM10022397_36270 [Flavivirga jejuensis]